MKVPALATLLFLVSGACTAATLVPLEPPKPDPGTERGAECDRACAARLEVDRHLSAMGDADDRTQRASLRKIASLGSGAVRAALEAYRQWSDADHADPESGARPGEMRWRAVYLLGELGVEDARQVLYDIARDDASEAHRHEIGYADDYRVRLRAVASLQALKGVDELKALHERGGALSNATAAALFELGVNVGNVRLVEAKAALAEERIDSRDFKPGKNRPVQPLLPGAPRFKVIPREDSPALRKEG